MPRLGDASAAAYKLLINGTYGLAALEALVDDLESRLTAARAGYLDNLNNSGLLTVGVAQHQDDAFLGVVNPVQNTWYTVLETTRARVYGMAFLVHTTGETIEMRLTLDGVAYTGSHAATAETDYLFFKALESPTLRPRLPENSHIEGVVSVLEGRVVKVEVRKTTANGTGSILSRVTWARWP